MSHTPLETSIDHLVSFLSQENLLLQQMKASQAQKLFAEKHRLMRDYEECSLQVRAHPSFFQALAPEIKKHMADKTHHLNELLKENAALTKRVLDAHTYYLDTLKRVAVKRLGIDVDTYTQGGKKHHPGTMNTRYGTNAHVALDRAL